MFALYDITTKIGDCNVSDSFHYFDASTNISKYWFNYQYQIIITVTNTNIYQSCHAANAHTIRGSKQDEDAILSTNLMNPINNIHNLNNENQDRTLSSSSTNPTSMKKVVATGNSFSKGGGGGRGDSRNPHKLSYYQRLSKGSIYWGPVNIKVSAEQQRETSLEVFEFSHEENTSGREFSMTNEISVSGVAKAFGVSGSHSNTFATYSTKATKEGKEIREYKSEFLSEKMELDWSIPDDSVLVHYVLIDLYCFTVNGGERQYVRIPRNDVVVEPLEERDIQQLAASDLHVDRRSFEVVSARWDVQLDNIDYLARNLTPKDITASKNVSYGDKIILQVNSLDNRWLTGGRGGGNEGVFTRDKLSSTYESTTAAESYQWIVRSEVGNGGRVTMDPKNGHCVKYGDKVHLQVNNLDNRWLTGGRGGGNEGVGTRNKLGSNYERTTAATAYEWIIRATPGNGVRSDKDTSVGRCVELGDIIHLQVNNLDNRWLTGGRGGGNEGVGTRDMFGNEYERVTARHTYEWIVLSEFGDGTRP